ncbi:MAG TPA: aldehyde dehydrogenase family protein, partial [Novosphingobium sp.]|nr:aldehyde dehydrogenase family protein [Novosphingobium sp.]
MTEYTLLIDGAAVATTASDPVIDPASGAVFAHAPQAGTAELERAVAAARAAFPAWAADEPLRRQVLARAAERLRERAGPIAQLITREQGRPLAQALGEVQYGAAILDSYAAFTVPDEVLAERPGAAPVQVVRAPLGVVAAITPWNVPVLLLLRDIVPALLAGNTVVAKPSEHTPLSSLALGRALADIFPAGVLNILAGGKELGAELTRHPDVAKVTFTGSVRGGKAVAAQTAGDLKRVSLELGGNDAAIVLADAPVEKVARALFEAAFFNAGQICFAVKRVYAARAVFAPLVAALAALADAARPGPGL